MTIHRMFPLFFVAMFALACLPAATHAQLISSCVRCDECVFESDRPEKGKMCMGYEDEFVVRHKCDAAEMARVATSEIASAPVPGG